MPYAIPCFVFFFYTSQAASAQGVADLFLKNEYHLGTCPAISANQNKTLPPINTDKSTDDHG
jgi:hypothetical protein